MCSIFQNSPVSQLTIDLSESNLDTSEQLDLLTVPTLDLEFLLYKIAN